MRRRGELAHLSGVLERLKNQYCKEGLSSIQCEKKSFSMKMLPKLLDMTPQEIPFRSPQDSGDIAAVTHHLNVFKTNPGSTTEPLPVIAVIRNGPHETLLLLDGLHRFVAANLMKIEKIFVIYVYLPINAINFS